MGFKNLPTWLKGGIVGFILGVVFVLSNTFANFETSIGGFFSVVAIALYFPFSFVFVILNSIGVELSIFLINLFVFVLWVVLGIVIGFLIKKIKG